MTTKKQTQGESLARHMNQPVMRLELSVEERQKLTSEIFIALVCSGLFLDADRSVKTPELGCAYDEILSMIAGWDQKGNLIVEA